jgi:hypothetical protein
VRQFCRGNLEAEIESADAQRCGRDDGLVAQRGSQVLRQIPEFRLDQLIDLVNILGCHHRRERGEENGNGSERPFHD